MILGAEMKRLRAGFAFFLASVSLVAGSTGASDGLLGAVRNGDLPLVRRMLSAEPATANKPNRYGVTPLSVACTRGDAETVDALLAAGADANLAIPGEETPLMTAARTGRVGVVNALLARGAEASAKLPGGQTALMWAAAEGHTAVVEALIAARADVGATVPTGLNALLFAVRSGHIDTARALLKTGLDINAVTAPTKTGNKLPKRGNSALTLSVENGHFEMAAVLLDLGADPNDLRSGYAPLHILAWIRKPDIGEDEGDPIPEDHGTVTSEQLIRKLVAKGANVNLRLTGGPSGGGRINRKGCTPFMLAADTADLEFMKLLRELGADPTLTNVDGCTPLMAAAGLGTRSAEEEAGTDDEAVAACAYLLELGADIDAVSNNGDTAMHGAGFANFPKVVKFLDAKGANIEVWNRKNKRGWTPLMVAEGHRFGNFKPSFETIAAFHEVMRRHGLVPPPPTPPVAEVGYKQL